MLASFEAYAQQVVEFVRVHEVWAAPIVFALAFGESLAFISLLIPAWAALVGIGVLIASGDLSFWPVFVAGSIGAALGDWLSYWIGIKLGPPVAHVWPLSRHPDLLPKGEAFVRRWGVLAIFIGRFFGPLRASVPLVAGIFHMPYWSFQFANFASAFLWAGVLLTLGDALARLWNAVRELTGGGVVWVVVLVVLLLGIGALIRYRRLRRRVASGE
jgi:membrane protein DedA with SNARE-associated domain